MGSAGDPDILDLVTFGETMVRLAPPDHQRLEVTGVLDLSIGGTESNLAIALSRLGRSTRWFSALPENPLGRRIAGEIARHGVDTSKVIWRPGSRAGVYFLELGAGPRPTRVIYDRANSAIATLPAEDVDPEVVKSGRLLHLTGITPALSNTCASICLKLADAARDAGRAMSFDVNYRSLLWTPDEARDGLQPLLDRTSLLFCGLADAETIWGFGGDPDQVAAGLLEQSAADLVVITLGEHGAFAQHRNGSTWEQPARAVHAIDPVGAGDAFAAAFIHRWLDANDDVPRALRSAVAMAGIAMTIPGDLAIITEDELGSAERDLSGSLPDIER